jgi:hypothetical protein
MLISFLLFTLADWIQRGQQNRIDYLVEENRGAPSALPLPVSGDRILAPYASRDSVPHAIGGSPGSLERKPPGARRDEPVNRVRSP